MFCFLLSWLWQALPKTLQDKVPDHSIILVLMPCLVVFCAAVLSLNPWIETTFLGGDTRTFITQKLGIATISAMPLWSGLLWDLL